MTTPFIPSDRPLVDPRTGAIDFGWLFLFKTLASGVTSVPWGNIDFTGSNFNDLLTRSASDLSSGTVPLARLSGITTTEIAAAAGILISQLASSVTLTSWTPTLIGSTTPGTQTYSVQVGKYIQILGFVYVMGRVTITAKDAAIAGSVLIGGLPVTPQNTANLNGGGSIGQVTGWTHQAGYTDNALEIRPNTANLRLIENGSGVAASTVPVANIAAATDIEFSAAYFV